MREAEGAPFWLTLCLVFLAYTGLGISVWPNVISPDISIWAAAAPPQSMGFTLVGALLIVPMILGYTGWSYYVFRGKVDAAAGYHWRRSADESNATSEQSRHWTAALLQAHRLAHAHLDPERARIACSGGVFLRS